MKDSVDNIMAGGEELPVAQGRIRITVDGEELGVVNDYPHLTAVNLLIDMAIGRAILKVAAMVAHQKESAEPVDTSSPLASPTLAYFALNERTGNEIMLRPPKIIQERIQEICDQRTDLLFDLGLKVSPVVSETHIILYVWGKGDPEAQPQEGNEEEEVGDIEAAMQRAADGA